MKSPFTQWISFIAGITLLVLAAAYMDVSPVVLFGVTHGIEEIFMERLFWWSLSVVF